MAYSGTVSNFLSDTVYATWELDDNGKLTANFPDTSDNTVAISRVIDGFGDSGAKAADVKSAVLTGNPKSLRLILSGFENLASVDLSALDSSRLTDMAYMFERCKNLASVDLSALDTSKVETAAFAFFGCDVLSSVKLGSKFFTDALADDGKNLQIAPCSNGSIYCADDAAFCALSAAEHAGTWTRNISDSFKVTGERTTDGKSDDDGNDVTFTVVWATTSTSSTRTLTIYKKEAGETDWPATAAGTWTLSGNSGNTVETLEDVGDEKADYKVVFDDGAVKRVAMVTIEGNKRLVTVDESGNFWCAGTVSDGTGDIRAAIPSKTSQMTNDSGYITASSVPTNTAIANLIYPVGSIYMSVISTSPATLFGGTWERIQDRFLLAAGPEYGAGETGGEAVHQLTADELPDHRHTFTTDSAGAHTHKTGHKRYDAYGTGKADAMHFSGTFDVTSSSAGAHTHSGTTNGAGGSQAHNNMPPYLAVYVWERTA